MGNCIDTLKKYSKELNIDFNNPKDVLEVEKNLKESKAVCDEYAELFRRMSHYDRTGEIIRTKSS